MPSGLKFGFREEANARVPMIERAVNNKQAERRWLPPAGNLDIILFCFAQKPSLHILICVPYKFSTQQNQGDYMTHSESPKFISKRDFRDLLDSQLIAKCIYSFRQELYDVVLNIEFLNVLSDQISFLRSHVVLIYLTIWISFVNKCQIILGSKYCI